MYRGWESVISFLEGFLPRHERIILESLAMLQNDDYRLINCLFAVSEHVLLDYPETVEN